MIRDAEERTARLLDALSKGLSVGGACREAGLVRVTAYRWRADDAGFAGAWDAALADGRDAFRDLVRERAVGRLEPVLDPDGRPELERDPATGEVVLDDRFEPAVRTRAAYDARAMELYARCHPEFATRRVEAQVRAEVAVEAPRAVPDLDTLPPFHLAALRFALACASGERDALMAQVPRPRDGDGRVDWPPRPAAPPRPRIASGPPLLDRGV